MFAMVHLYKRPLWGVLGSSLCLLLGLSACVEVPAGHGPSGRDSPDGGDIWSLDDLMGSSPADPSAGAPAPGRSEASVMMAAAVSPQPLEPAPTSPSGEPAPPSACGGEPGGAPDAAMEAGRGATADPSAMDAGDAPSASDAAVPDDGPPAARVPAVGMLVITELMPNPSVRTDAEGEWIELYNPGDEALDLASCALGDGEAAGAPLGAGTLAPGALWLVARSEQPGFVPDVVAAISLRNTSDVVVLRCGGVEIDRVGYGAEGQVAPVAGASLSLSPSAWDAEANDEGGAWCLGRAGEGDLGTPGAPNDPCDA